MQCYHIPHLLTASPTTHYQSYLPQLAWRHGSSCALALSGVSSSMLLGSSACVSRVACGHHTLHSTVVDTAASAVIADMARTSGSTDHLCAPPVAGPESVLQIPLPTARPSSSKLGAHPHKFPQQRNVERQCHCHCLSVESQPKL